MNDISELLRELLDKHGNTDQLDMEFQMLLQSDDELKVADKDLVYALSHCQYWAQLKLHGDDGMNHVKLISKEQIEDFSRTVKLYLLRGGSFK